MTRQTATPTADGEAARIDKVLARLLKATRASRATLRLDDERRGWHVSAPAGEAVAKGVSSMRADRSIDHRAAATTRWLAEHRRTLVQPDLDRAAQPEPPKGLRESHHVKAQMLSPLMQPDGRLAGWISVHYLEVPRAITRPFVEALDKANGEIRQLLDLGDAPSVPAGAAAPTAPADPVGAFCRANHVALAGAGKGPLKGLSFAAKDAFDVKGVATGFGQPAWLAAAVPARRTARAVKLLLDGGADLVAKAHCDELCYSLTGENVHYGTPENVAAPGRIPGGSSNGSAAAVAAGLVDFALGSDCGGSVRIPASYCGLYGIRPTWGGVSLAGALPFGPSFDVAGWLARDPDILERVGRVILREPSRPRRPTRLLVATDAFALVEPAVTKAMQPAVETVKASIGAAESIVVAPDGLEAWFECFRTIQAYEVWRSVGDWVERSKPKLGPGIKERLAWARTVTPDAHARAARKRLQIRRHMKSILQPGVVLCLPTSPRVAPLRGSPADTVEVEYRNQAMKLLCISGLCGLPQISLPLASLHGLPLGVSLIGPRGADTSLLAVASRL